MLWYREDSCWKLHSRWQRGTTYSERQQSVKEKSKALKWLDLLGSGLFSFSFGLFWFGLVGREVINWFWFMGEFKWNN